MLTRYPPSIFLPDRPEDSLIAHDKRPRHHAQRMRETFSKTGGDRWGTYGGISTALWPEVS